MKISIADYEDYLFDHLKITYLIIIRAMVLIPACL